MTNRALQEQLLGLFFEESSEGIETLEAGLLRLGNARGGDNTELINDIFRAAHSIKGAAGTFGFSDISNFTHVMETLLDEVREGERLVNATLIDLLLAAVDCLRGMLSSVGDGSPIDTEMVQETQRALQALLESERGKTGSVAIARSSQEVQTAGPGGRRTEVKIDFAPFTSMLHSGNDVVPLLRELRIFANDRFHSICAPETIPPLEDLVAEDCYLAWTLRFATDRQRDDIDEIFSWVDGECDLKVVMTPPLRDSTDLEAAATAEVKQQPESGPEQAATKAARDVNQADTGRAGTSNSTGSIRVSIDKIDGLMNMVGELVITQSMLGEIETSADITTARLEHLRDGLAQLARNTRELQESVMRIRSMPISVVFSRFPRLVHDISHKLEKKVTLRLVGESTELDKTVLEKLGDPLVHLIRNSLDHGLEPPEERRAAGKSETGTLELNAYHMGGNIIIRVRDDGRGINTDLVKQRAVERDLLTQEEADKMAHEDAVALIFRAGFSTATSVSDLSGRGVGMDVVRQNIRGLGGSIMVESRSSEGTTMTIRLPLTLAILEGQIIRVGANDYIVPLVSIIESIQVKSKFVNHLAGRGYTYRLRNEPIPILKLHELFGVEADTTSLEGALLVVVEADGKRVGLMVDELLAQQQVVIKNLDDNYGSVAGVAGATILGNGTVSFILDANGLINLAQQKLVDRTILGGPKRSANGTPDSKPRAAAA